MAKRDKNTRIIRKLKDTQVSYRELFDSIKICVVVCKVKDEGQEFVVKDLNTQAEITEKVRRSDVVGRDILEIFPGAGESGILEAMQRVWKTETPERIRDKLYRGKHVTCWRDTFIYRLPSGDVVEVYEDVSERMKALETLRDAEERYRTVADYTHSWEFWQSPEGKFKYVSPSCERVSGYAPSDFYRNAKLMDKIALPEDGPLRQAHLEKVRNLIEDTCTFRIRHRDGDIRWIEHHCEPLLNKNGEWIGTRGANRDVTARRLAEQKLAESEERYRTILEDMDEGYYELDLNGNFKFFNDAVCRLTGYSRQELTGMSYRVLVPENDLKPIQTTFNAMYRTGDKSDLQTRARIHKDGSLIYIEGPVLPIKDAGGATVGFRGIIRDITAKKTASEELALRAELLDSANDSIALLDLEGNFLYVNQAFCSERGYSRDEILLMNITHIIAPSMASAVKSYISKLRAKGEILFETEHIDSVGKIIPVEIHSRIITHGGKERILSVIRDITQRKVNEQAHREIQERFYNAFNSSPDPMAITDIDTGNIVEVNTAFAAWSGFAIDEMAGRTTTDLGFWAYPVEREQMVSQLRATGTINELPVHFRQKNGDIRDMLFSVKLIEVGGRMMSFSHAQDITERKSAEAALRESEQRFSAAFNTSPDPLSVSEFPSGKRILVNPAFETWSGYSSKELLGNTLEQLAANKEDRDYVIEQFRLSNALHDLRLQLRTKSGDLRDVLFSTSLFQAGGISYLLSRIHDITARMAMEKAVQQSEAMYRLLAENSDDVIWTVGSDLNYTYVSPAVRKLRGYEPHELIGTPLLSSLTQDSLNAAIRMLEDNRSDIEHGADIAMRIEMQSPRKDGTEVWTETSVRTLRDKDGLYAGFIGVSRDISERKQAQELLNATEQRFNQFFEQATNYCYMISPEGNILNLNRAALDFLGYGSKQDVVGRPVLTTLYPPRSQERARELLSRWRAGGKLENEEITIANRKGEERQVLLSVGAIRDDQGTVLYSVSIQTDITAQKLLQEEQLRLEKLGSLGTLAGGIAHDFNNIMGAVLGNISLARTEVEASSAAGEYLVESERAILRAKDLTRQLLAFSRGGVPDKRVSSLREIIIESAGFAVHGSKCRCEFQVDPELWPADIDRGQVSQVISNLVINARQAMPSGGLISIVAENVTPGCRQDAARSLPLPDGRYVRIIVRDQGVGIPAENVAQIFDPYFTTKKEGTGLGLATCFSIIRNHGGHISVESRPGRTSFSVYIPASSGDIEATAEAYKADPSRLKGRILVMDDEAALRDVVGAMLRHMGMEDVVTAASGEEAVRLFADAMVAGMPFDAVILDLTIPAGMGGVDTLKALKEMDPGVAAIVSSGYTGESSESEYVQKGFRAVISKPYTIDELRHALKGIVN